MLKFHHLYSSYTLSRRLDVLLTLLRPPNTFPLKNFLNETLHADK